MYYYTGHTVNVGVSMTGFPFYGLQEELGFAEFALAIQGKYLTNLL